MIVDLLDSVLTLLVVAEAAVALFLCAFLIACFIKDRRGRPTTIPVSRRADHPKPYASTGGACGDRPRAGERVQ